jgi:Skp family chaperone for outer membrane proteins
MSTRPSLFWSKGLVVMSLACLGVGAAATFQSATAQAGQKAAPTAVAVINLNRVLEQLNETKDAMAKLEIDNKKGQAKLDEINTQINTLKTRLDAMPKGQRSPERAQLEGQLLELNVQGRARLEVLQQLQSVDSGTVAYGIYTKIVEAVKKYSEAQGIDLVLTDDSGITLPVDKPITDKDVGRYTNDRQVIYAAAKIDLTDQIIQMMNNEYAAKAGRR